MDHYGCFISRGWYGDPTSRRAHERVNKNQEVINMIGKVRYVGTDDGTALINGNVYDCVAILDKSLQIIDGTCAEEESTQGNRYSALRPYNGIDGTAKWQIVEDRDGSLRNLFDSLGITENSLAEPIELAEEALELANIREELLRKKYMEVSSVPPLDGVYMEVFFLDKFVYYTTKEKADFVEIMFYRNPNELLFSDMLHSDILAVAKTNGIIKSNDGAIGQVRFVGNNSNGCLTYGEVYDCLSIENGQSLRVADDYCKSEGYMRGNLYSAMSRRGPNSESKWEIVADPYGHLHHLFASLEKGNIDILDYDTEMLDNYNLLKKECLIASGKKSNEEVRLFFSLREPYAVYDGSTKWELVGEIKGKLADLLKTYDKAGFDSCGE